MSEPLEMNVDFETSDTEMNMEADMNCNVKVPLPIASATQLGGIKVGENLSIAPDGTLSAEESAVDDTLTIAGAAADAKKTGDEISGLKEDLTDGELANVLTAIPLVGSTAWKPKNISNITGQESSGESTKIISTGYYPVDESCDMSFTGVIRGTGETVDRSFYTYCYDEQYTYIERTNRGLLTGTKFVRFTYGFTSTSPNTISSYGMQNLINDWDMEFTPTYLKRLSDAEEDIGEIKSDLTGTISDLSDLSDTADRNALSTVFTAIPNPRLKDWEVGTLNSNTGAEQDNVRQIRTGFFPAYEKTGIYFNGVLDDSGTNRMRYVYCYDANKTFIDRTTSNLVPGTRFVRFTYGFISTSENTVESYGKQNLVNDWSIVFTPSFEKPVYEFDGNRSCFESQEWFEKGLNISDFLKFEKTACVHHDNFARANNSNDIGYNGTAETVYNVPPYKMEYGTLSKGTGNLKVGISSNRAVGSGGSNGDVVIKTVDAGVYPYKVIVSALTAGELAIGAISASEFISIAFNKDTVSLVGINTKQIWAARDRSHYSDVPVYTVYVYEDRIAVYNCGVEMFEAPALLKSTVCGIVFRREQNSTYKYTCLDVFAPSVWMQDGLDIAIEQYSTSVFNVADADDVETRNANALRTFGQLQTGTTYGITLDTTSFLRSKRSMRFELRYGDPIVSSGARSEIVPVRPKGNEITLHSKILDFDIMFGDDYDSDSGEDIIMQMHDLPDGVNMAGLSPGIALKVISNVLYLSTMGSSTKVLVDADRPTQTLTQIATVEKNVWHHITVYLREGYMEIHNPVTAVWYDGELKTIDYGLNCYNEARGSYPKFGIYKSWMHGATQTTNRTLWIDNVNLWY